MYDALTSRYTFACPILGESRVALSDFRSIERLEGTAHPVVYRVRFACTCGGDGSPARAEAGTAASSATTSSTGRRSGSRRGSS